MNRMKAADITQLRYLFNMYYRVFFLFFPTDDRNKKIDYGFSIFVIN